MKVLNEGTWTTSLRMSRTKDEIVPVPGRVTWNTGSQLEGQRRRVNIWRENGIVMVGRKTSKDSNNEYVRH